MKNEKELSPFLQKMKDAYLSRKENPEIIKASRIQRIARGAGVKQEEVKELLKYYATTKKAVENLKRGKMLKMGGPIGQIMRQLMFKEK